MDDDYLHPIISLKAALAAWVMGGIMHSSPPGCFFCTHTLALRIVMLDSFESYLIGGAIALVLPYVRMPQYIAEKTLLPQLLKYCEVETYTDVLSRNCSRVPIGPVTISTRDD